MGKPQLEKTREKYVFSYIEKNKQKKYAYRFRHTRKDGTRKEMYRQGFKTAKEATLALTELKAELLKGNYNKVDYKDLSVEDLFEMFIEYQTNKVTMSTLMNTKNVRKKICKYIGSVKLTQLNSYIYRRDFLSIVEKDLAQGTLKAYDSKMNAALNFAVKNEMIDRNRIKGESFEASNRKKIYTTEEVETIFKVAEKYPHLHAPILFLMHTGVRVGEMLSIKWRDIDFDKNLIDINCTYTKFGESKPKSKNSVRKIPMSKKLMLELKKYKAHRKATLLQKGMIASVSKEKFEPQYVFVATNGTTTLNYDHIKRFFKKVQQAGLKEATPHVFRHTFASRLISEGIDIATVASLLGDTIDTVQKTYVHAIENKKEEAINKLDKIMFYH